MGYTMKRIPLLLIYNATVTMVALAWSSLAFCGEIHDAAKSGDLEKVKALRKGNPNLVFSKDTIGRTPLHWAAKAGHNKDVVELLLVNKAEINAKRKDGCTPLQWAALQSQKDVAELLRRHGGGTNKLLESKQCCLTDRKSVV